MAYGHCRDGKDMPASLNPPIFPFLDGLRLSNRLMSFKEFLSTTVDENEDYRRLTDQGIKSLLHLKSLGHILASQPLGVLADLTTEFEKANRRMIRETEPVDEEEDIDIGTEVVPSTDTTPERSVLERSQAVIALVDPLEVGVVRETLTEVLAKLNRVSPH